jgi:DNA-dependent RNA polymerase auxiliary subunit epsilon
MTTTPTPMRESADALWIQIKVKLAMRRMYEAEVTRLNREIMALNETAGRTT